MNITSVDKCRDLIIPGDKDAMIEFCVKHFLECAKKAIADHGTFAVALSGGSTPKAIFEKLSAPPYADQINWGKVLLFWSDERATPPHHPESNFYMAMGAGFQKLPIPSQQIFRMKAEAEIQANAQAYEALLRKKLPSGAFDLVMLGMGDDGHTASLFPHTVGLHSAGKWVVANEVPQLGCWRMTLTFDCINQARNVAIYVIGKNKEPMLQRVLTGSYDPDSLPAQRLGTPSRKALWIADTSAMPQIPFFS